MTEQLAERISVEAARCRICGAVMWVYDLDDTTRDRGLALLSAHMTFAHSKTEIIDVYVLGKPWWRSMSDPDSQADET